MRRRSLLSRDDEGASLLLVLGVTTMVGAIMGALIPFITTSFNARTQLDALRQRQYAADLAIEEAIAKVRRLDDPAYDACGPFNRSNVNGLNIHVDCLNSPDVVLAGTTLVDQRNVVFSACVGSSNTNSFCTSATTLIRAQVNFEMPSGDVTRTYVQSWSVNR
ncbi:MAG: hypothetical protein AB7L13_04255 [Acidimicrobiia bacterium]